MVFDALENAPDQEKYIDALGKMESHYQAATALGLKVEKPPTATWEEHQAIKAKEEQIKAANAGYWFSSKATEQAEAEKFTKEMKALPGYREARPGSVPLVEGNYLATPAMPAPTVPDYQAIRGAPAPGQVAAPVAGATAAGGGSTAALPAPVNMSVDEAKKMGIPNPVRGTTYDDPKTGKAIRVL